MTLQHGAIYWAADWVNNFDVALMFSSGMFVLTIVCFFICYYVTKAKLLRYNSHLKETRMKSDDTEAMLVQESNLLEED